MPQVPEGRERGMSHQAYCCTEAQQKPSFYSFLSFFFIFVFLSFLSLHLLPFSIHSFQPLFLHPFLISLYLPWFPIVSGRSVTLDSQITEEWDSSASQLHGNGTNIPLPLVCQIISRFLFSFTSSSKFSVIDQWHKMRQGRQLLQWCWFKNLLRSLFAWKFVKLSSSLLSCLVMYFFL